MKQGPHHEYSILRNANKLFFVLGISEFTARAYQFSSSYSALMARSDHRTTRRFFVFLQNARLYYPFERKHFETQHRLDHVAEETGHALCCCVCNNGSQCQSTYCFHNNTSVRLRRNGILKSGQIVGGEMLNGNKK